MFCVQSFLYGVLIYYIMKTEQAILDKLGGLLKVPGVVGFEKPLTNYIKSLCEKCYDYETEINGGLIVVKKKNSNSKKILSIHIDRHGLVYTKGQYRYSAFEQLKNHGSLVEAEESVFEKVASRYIGETFYAYNSETGEKIAEGKVKGSKYNFEEKYVSFDIEGLNLEEGTPLALVSNITYTNDYFSSQIDNSISVAVAIQLLEDGFDGMVVFTVEEEIGLSWKYLSEYLKNNTLLTKELIVLDTSPYKYVHAIDNGLVVLRNRDEEGIFNEELTKSILSVCKKHKIPYEFKDEVIKKTNEELEEQGLDPKKFGHTELGRIVENTNGLINGATIQLPSVDYHTNNETSSMKSLANYYKLLRGLLLN